MLSERDRMKWGLRGFAALAICGVIAALGWGGPASARGSPRGQFSGNGNYYARLVSSTVTVWNYTDWPARPVIKYEIKLDVSGVEDWRISDKGEVWLTLPRGGLFYYPQNPKDANANYGTFFTSGIPAFRKAAFGLAKDQSVFFFEKTPGADNITEHKCRLTPEIFSETGVERFCTSRQAFPAPLPFAPVWNDLVCSAYCITINNIAGLDYALEIRGAFKGEAPKAYLYSVDGKQTVGADISNIGTIYRAGYFAITRPESSSSYSTLKLMHADGSTAKSIRVPYGEDSPFDWDITPDQRYVILGFSKSLAVVDVRHQDRSPRVASVTVEGLGGAHPYISPNGRFLIYSADATPRLIAPFVDPDYDKPVDLKVDILMAKILSALDAGRYKDAIPLFEDIEDLGVDPGEEFYFYQADTLARYGLKATAKEKARAFVARFGRASSHYPRMIEILAQ